MMVREAYYEALRELGIARDGLQQRIGVFHAEVQAARATLARRAPSMLERFDKAAELAGDHLMDDLVADTPANPEPEAKP